MENRNPIRLSPYTLRIKHKASSGAHNRIGFGFDSHQFKKRRNLILGGVLIPFPKGLFGHSDGDVLIHAIGDALLGAAGLKDIGYHFPDTDQKYKNISSLLLLSKIIKIIKKRDYKITNIDTTLILDQPKIAPYVNRMKERLSKTLNIPTSKIGIKAKTPEGLGVVFKKTALCFAVAILYKK